jgi:hypothetical protein
MNWQIKPYSEEGVECAVKSHGWLPWTVETTANVASMQNGMLMGILPKTY